MAMPKDSMGRAGSGGLPPAPGSWSSEGDGAVVLRWDPPIGMESWGGLQDRCPLTSCRRRCARASICCSATTLRFCALGILFRAGACRQQSRAAPSRASRSSTSSQATPGIREPVRIQQLLPRLRCLLAGQLYARAASLSWRIKGQKPHDPAQGRIQTPPT